MNISELIAKLEKAKAECGDMEVLVDGYEDGYQKPSGAAVGTYRKSGRDGWWSGDHQEDPDGKPFFCIKR